jgi:hypothetical protein
MSFHDFIHLHINQLGALPSHLRVKLWQALETSSLNQDFTTNTGATRIVKGWMKEEMLWIVPHVATFTQTSIRDVLHSHTDELNQLISKRFPRGTTTNLRDDVYALTDGYQLSLEQNQAPVQHWFVRHEVTAMMQDSEDGNFQLIEFFDLFRGIAVTIMWNRKDVRAGDAITRNFLPQSTSAERRHLLLMYFPWMLPQSMDEYLKKLQGWKSRPKPKTSSDNQGGPALPLWKKKHIKIFTDDARKLFGDMSRPAFKTFCTLVDTPEEADLIWLGRKMDPSIRNHLKHSQFVNQFPGQDVLTVKDLLAKSILDCHGVEETSTWLPLTFNLNFELEAFLGQFAESEPGTLWLTKPYNSARSQNIVISRGLPCILRQLSTGPKVVSKYIHPPHLFRGKKYDVRVNVILDSVNPIKLYTCPTFQYPRIASDYYDATMDDMDDFGSCFSVMNYAEGDFKWHIVHHDEFVREFERENGTSWYDIVPKIHTIVRKAFEAAVHSGRLKQDEHAKTLIGFDLMLDSQLNPWLIEASMTPDTGRILRFEPDLYPKLWRFVFTEEGRKDLDLKRIFVEI